MHGEGPLLVLAGAGSGKTRVIIHRIAHLITQGVSPQKILGLTFTNKAAQEMKGRLRVLMGRQSTGVTLSTFHALGLSILREETEAAGLQKGFVVYDTSDQESLVRELLRQVKVADRRLDVSRILSIVLRTKKARLDEVALDWGDEYELAAYTLYPKYRAQMRAFNAIDFDDLIILAQDVLGNAHVRQRWSKRYQYLLVDEYQDTSPDQLELVRVLAGDSCNVCAVGDDDQAIYAWRGAAVDNILSFSKHFKNTKEVVLDQNYRSTGHILTAANKVIQHNSKRKVKNLWSSRGEGEPVDVVCCGDAEDEAECVTETVQKLLYEGAKPEDIAVLYRSNVQSRVIEETFALHGIAFRVVGGQAFFDRKEVKDAMAFLSVLHNPKDDIALRRIVNVPPRGVGPASIERLVLYAQERGVGLWEALKHAHEVEGLPKASVAGAQAFVSLMEHHRGHVQNAAKGCLAQAVKNFLDALGLREAILQADDAASVCQRRLDNVEEVVHAVERFERFWQEHGDVFGAFIVHSSIVRDVATEDEESFKGRVTLMTLHSAKGLEFPYVMMVGVEEDILPHKKSMEGGLDVSEERRLCYVGITRARKKLWMLHTSVRNKHGKTTPVGMSRFLQDLGEGPYVRRYNRTPPTSQQDAQALAAEFFRKIQQQLQ